MMHLVKRGSVECGTAQLDASAILEGWFRDSSDARDVTFVALRAGMRGPNAASGDSIADTMTLALALINYLGGCEG